MAANDPNIALIEVVAARLGDDLLEQVVFVGGAVAGLLVTDAAMPAIRPTEDVDLIVPARGQGDSRCSHDLGDLIAVVDGRDELQGKCERAPDELKRYLAARVRALLATPDFVDALPGHLPPDTASQDRLPDLMDKLEALANLSVVPR